MSGSRFVYILFLIFMAFGAGSFIVHNWGNIKTYVPANLAASSEEVGRETISVIDRIKSSAQTIIFGQDSTESAAGPVVADRVITSPIGAAPGSAASNTAKKPGGPHFTSMHLTREAGSRFSGNGKPGWNVTIEANGRPLGRTKVNKLGSWELIVEDPMKKENYKFGIVGRAPGSSTQIEQGEDAVVKFMQSDGMNKILMFSTTGIGAVTMQKPTLKPDTPVVEKPKIAALPDDKSAPSSTDDIPVTERLIKKASELGDATSKKFTEILEDLKPKASDETKLAEAPKAPLSTGDKKPSPSTTAKKPASGEPVLSVDKAMEKAGRLASDAKKGIVGYLDKLGLSGKPGDDEGQKPGLKKPEPKKPEAVKALAALSFDKVDMTDDKGRTGKLKISGRSEPGATINIFLGQRSIGSAVANASGRWTFTGMRNIPYGNNLLGAVQRDKTGKVLNRAEYSLRRVAPKTVVAINKPKPGIATPPSSIPAVIPKTSSATSTPKATLPTNRADTARTYSKPFARSGRKVAKYRKKRVRLARAKRYKRKYRSKSRRKTYRKHRRKYARVMKLGARAGLSKRSRQYRKSKSYGRKSCRRCGCKRGQVRYRVRRGDSLWKISKKYYGNGRRYRKIYRANRKRIRNPNRIYKNQRICIGR